MRLIPSLASVSCLLLATGPAAAYTSVTGVSSGGRLTGGLLLQDTDYRASRFDYNVDTTLLFAGYKAALSPKFALGGGLGLVLDGELGQDYTAKDGSGLQLFLDGQFEIKQWGKNTLFGTFALTHDRYTFNEDAIGRNIDLDFTMTEIKIGGLFAHRISSVSLHGGLEAYLYTKGDLEDSVNSISTKRDDRLNVRLGGTFAVDSSIDLRAELFLLSEQTVLLGADFRL